MKINKSKTKMLVLGTPAMLREIPKVFIPFNGVQLNESETVKSLGLVLDRHLNYQAHADSWSQDAPEL